VVVVDGVWTRSPDGSVRFHSAAPPTQEELAAIIVRVRERALTWLRRHGHIDEHPEEERSQEPRAQTALEACAAIAMARGQTRILGVDHDEHDHGSGRPAVDGAVESDGFNLHAGVSIPAGDDEGRETLCRYAARPAISLQRLRRLPGGLVAYHLKYVRGARAKHRVMDAMECLARIAALVPPPRYPLVRYAGVLGPRSAWRKDIVPSPRESISPCEPRPAQDATTKTRDERGRRGDGGRARSDGIMPPAGQDIVVTAKPARVEPGDVERLTANVLSVRHWDRLLGGLLYATTPRMDWARLLRRSLDVDVLRCPKCDGRLRVLTAVTERASVARILAHLGMPIDAPPLARARDPTDDIVDDEGPVQLELLA
jgi:hypothetical protein